MLLPSDAKIDQCYNKELVVDIKSNFSTHWYTIIPIAVPLLFVFVEIAVFKFCACVPFL